MKNSSTAASISQLPLEIWTQPKAYFLGAAFLSFLLSVGLWFSGDRELGLFVGLWVPSICSAASK